MVRWLQGERSHWGLWSRVEYFGIQSPCWQCACICVGYKTTTPYALTEEAWVDSLTSLSSPSQILEQSETGSVPGSGVHMVSGKGKLTHVKTTNPALWKWVHEIIFYCLGNGWFVHFCRVTKLKFGEMSSWWGRKGRCEPVPIIGLLYWTYIQDNYNFQHIVEDWNAWRSCPVPKFLALLPLTLKRDDEKNKPDWATFIYHWNTVSWFCFPFYELKKGMFTFSKCTFNSLNCNECIKIIVIY